MSHRLWLLSLPSAAVLACLVYHSFHALPRRRAVTFWIAAAVYGVLRGLGVRLITERVLGASFPYVIHDPWLSVLGVSVQEVAGWAIAAYLAWWLGCEFARRISANGSPRLFPQIAWASLFLGALSWAVETTAVAMGWWHWTLPAAGGLLGKVPFIGLVDWFFVGFDFLLPFTLFSAARPLPWPARLVALAAFPVHFGAHAFTARAGALLPIPIFHLAHWTFVGILLWLALRSKLEDSAFRSARGFWDWLPLGGLGLVVVDLALVQALWAQQLELWLSLLPVVALALASIRLRWGYATGIAAVLFALVQRAGILAAVPAAVAAVLRWGQAGGRGRAVVLLTALAVAAAGVHSMAARREKQVRAGLDAALAARDRGDLDTAIRKLQELNRLSPAAHAPHAFLGEIYYRLDRLPEARAALLAAVSLQPDYLAGQKHLAVIDLRLGDNTGARERAVAALRIAPHDLELEYLRDRAGERDPTAFWDKAIGAGPAAVEALAGLAYEVGDITGSALALDRGIERWPEHRPFYRKRFNLARSLGDDETARRIAASWASRFPEEAAMLP